MDVAADRERPGKPGDESPVQGTGQPAEQGQASDTRELDARAALDETTPADRAEWEEAADALDRSS